MKRISYKTFLKIPKYNLKNLSIIHANLRQKSLIIPILLNYIIKLLYRFLIIKKKIFIFNLIIKLKKKL